MKGKSEEISIEILNDFRVIRKFLDEKNVVLAGTLRGICEGIVDVGLKNSTK